MSGIGGINAYKQTNNVWNQRNEKAETDNKSAKENGFESVKSAADKNVTVSPWKPINKASSLIPTNRDGIGMSIGDVQLSDKAKEYYNKLKSKFGNMQFIAVSSDMKEQVKANAAAYGNSAKMVVLIDDAKLEQMANDESFRKKYEGIIAMSQNRLTEARNSLAGSGANIKNFGMSVNSDGSTSFFATIEKSSKDQAERLAKKQAQKKAEKAKEKKASEKEALKKRLEKIKEAGKSDEIDSKENINSDDKKYVKIEADSVEELINTVSKYAYKDVEASVMTHEEKSVGQSIDFKG